jgi:undecaprenyl-diphosphatase
LPAVLLGLLFGKLIKAHLFTPVVVASTFILGGFVILWAERRPQSAARIHSVDDMSALDALKVGLVQCLAMIPGTSRSGATIIGGMLLGLSRQAATDFSFFLAIPTLIGAGAYSLYKERALLSMADLPLFAVGLFFSFISAWVCVRWLLRYISSHSFVPFAWYRIAFGIAVLVTAWLGLVRWAS